MCALFPPPQISSVAILRWQGFRSSHEHPASTVLEHFGVMPGAQTQPHVLAWRMGSEYRNCVTSKQFWLNLKGLATVFIWIFKNSEKTMAHPEFFLTLAPRLQRTSYNFILFLFRLTVNLKFTIKTLQAFDLSFPVLLIFFSVQNYAGCRVPVFSNCWKYRKFCGPCWVFSSPSPPSWVAHSVVFGRLWLKRNCSVHLSRLTLPKSITLGAHFVLLGKES